MREPRRLSPVAPDASEAARWQRLESLFHAAIALPDVERGAFLITACGDDRALRDELARLVASAGDSLRGVIAAEAHALTARASQLGRRIGRFRIVGLIGEGGMGAVYLGERDDAEFSQRVAIKLLARAGESPEAVARFRAERQILAGLEHPNIVRMLDGGTTDDGLPYLVMEHIDGPPITRYAEQQRLSIRARVGLVRQACAALQYAHQNLIVHRDIKPSNILVDEGGLPKLVDFGIAKLLGAATAATGDGEALFTPGYASPEQTRCDPISTATDVYSLGAVLYELVTDTPAHRACIDRASLRASYLRDPPRASTVAPHRRRELAGDLDAILGKAMHHDAAQRYASIAAFADDLARWLDGLPVLARADTVAYRTGKLVRRHKLTTAALALVGAILISATLISLRQAQRADEQAARAERAQREAIEALSQKERECRQVN